MKSILLLGTLLLGSGLLAEDEVKINAMNANAALRSVVFAVGYKSLAAKPVEIDTNRIVATSLELLKGQQVPAVWGNPDNKSDIQLLKAFLGTRLTCSSVCKDSDDKTRLRVQTQCLVSRREITDPSKALTFPNTQDKILWDAPSPEVIVMEKDVAKQVQSQISTILEQFVAKYKKNDFKTSLAETYYKSIK